MKRNAGAWMLLAAAWVLSRKRVTWGDGWVWPLPTVIMRGKPYHPVITSGFGDMRAGGPHGGVDIVYARKSANDLIDAFPVGTTDGGARWIAPPRVPVLSARAGRVWSVEKTSRGWAVVISHGAPWATFYTHLESCALPLHARGKNENTGAVTHVKAGDILGVMGWDPTDPERVRHLHFATWYDGTNDDSVDPAQAMRSWPVARTVTLTV